MYSSLSNNYYILWLETHHDASLHGIEYECDNSNQVTTTTNKSL